MKATVYLSRKLLNQLKVKETESKDLMLTHNLHNIIINGKRVGCSTVLTLWQNSTANRYPNKSLLLISIRLVFGQNSRTGLMRI